MDNANAQRRSRVEQAERQEVIVAVINDGQFAQDTGAILLANALGVYPRMPRAHGGFGRRRDAEPKPFQCSLAFFQRASIF